MVHGYDYGLEEEAQRKVELYRHPEYYRMGGIIVREIIKAYKLPWDLACVIKYVLRCQYKGNIKGDLEKAKQCLEYYIEDITDSDDAPQE